MFWLPLVGPIIQGISGYFSKKQDVDLEKYKVDGKVNIEALLAANQLTLGFKDDIGVRINRDIVLTPMCVWLGLGGWDKIMANKYPDLVWNVAPFPTSGGLEYLPIAVVAFLFGLSWKAMR